MKLSRSIFVILFLCMRFLGAYSFQIAKADSTVVPIHAADSILKTLSDTNLTGFQFSRPGYGAFFYNQTLGNLGSAFRSVNFWDDEKEFFNLGMNQYKIYEFTEAINRNIPKRKTFSNLKFINGSKKEQNFSIKHFQRLTKEISFGLDFGIAHSDGFYTKQISNLRNFNVYTSIHTTNEKYNVLLNYLSNKIVANENGGLVNDTTFELAGSFDSKVAAVNFSDVKNQHKTKIFYVQQQYNLFRKDSTDSSLISKSRFFLKDIFKYDTRSALFTTDQAYDSFFENTYYDTTQTNDSLFVKNFYNEISLNVENVSALKGKAAFYLNGDHQYFNFFQEDTIHPLSAIDTVLRNISLKPGGGIDWQNGLGIDFYFQKNFNKLKSEFYKIFASVHFNQKEKNRLVKFSLEHSIRSPDFIYCYYNSNHFIWYNKFDPVDFSKAELSGEVKFSKQSLKLVADYFSVKNLTYFNEEALPQQFQDRVNVLNVDLFHSIKVGKFNFVNNFSYQHADKKEIVKLPDFSSYMSIFYDDNFFKRALYAQFGVDVRYCTLYFADSYMPATGQFYLQDEKKIGNYAYVDVFANFRIKTFRFFLKFEHLNAGFTERVYYTVPHYPMAGRTFKFGVIWDFFD